MDMIKSALEWYFGIPPADPGQGTAWNFDFRSPWPDWVPPWAVFLLAVLVIGYVVWVYLGDTKSLTVGRRVLLLGLRLVSIAVLLLMLTELTLSVDRTGLPFIAVLIDDSASMGLEDRYDDSVQQQIGRRLDGTTRLDLAKEILTRDGGSFLKHLKDRHKLRVYRFSETAVLLGQSEYVRSAELDELLELVGRLGAEGNSTRPGPALRKVLNDFRGTPPTACILLTDGIASTTDADSLTTVAELARNKGVPVYAVGIGSEQPARDLQLYDALAEEMAFVDDPLSISAKLKGHGFDGRQVTVTLKQRDTRSPNSPETVLNRQQVTLPDDGKPTKVEVTHVPEVEGEFDYILEVTPLPGETNRKNNTEIRHVSVRREKIRVLLVDTLPRYEFRYVKTLLERDSTIELDTVLQDADVGYASEDETALPHFPVKREDLFQYDVVIFGDVNPSVLGNGVLQNLREFVSEAGGGLLMVAGELNNPLEYAGTLLEDMLPIDLTDARLPSADAPLVEPFAPELTLEGRNLSLIFRFADSEPESLKVWRDLPGLYWMVEAPRLKPGAVVFVEHPTRRGAVGKLPVIAMQRYGAGKVLFHATDELWRWRFRTGDAYFGRYWVQAIRYLSRSRLLGQTRSAELTTDRLVYPQGTPVSLRVRFLDERLIPREAGGVTVIVERQGGSQQTVALKRLPQAPTVFEGQFSGGAEGPYHAWVARPSFSEAPPSADFRVESPQRELENRSLASAELTQTARVTHGGYYSVADAERLLDDLPAGSPVPLESEDPILLWNRWETLVLFAGLLAIEWLLRKRYRLI